MPRYHFHILGGQNQPDDLGLDLPNLDAAKEETLSFAGAILRNERPMDIWQGRPWRMKVTDSPRLEGGTTLLTLALTATDETLNR